MTQVKDYYIRYILLENFKGIFDGCGKDKLELEFPNPKDLPSKIVLFMGKTGSGKSTVLSCLHPFSSTFDGRDDTIILENEEGLKEVVISSMTQGIEYKIVHHYLLSGGKRKIKSFIKKLCIEENSEEELNPAGLVTGFKEIIQDLFGLSQDYFAIGRLADATENFTDKPPAKRKELITSILPNSKPYLDIYKKVKEKFNKTKATISFLANEISQIGDQEELESNLATFQNKKSFLDKKLFQLSSKEALLSENITAIKKENNLENFEELQEEKKTIAADILSLQETYSEFSNIKNIKKLERTANKIKISMDGKRELLRSIESEEKAVLYRVEDARDLLEDFQEELVEKQEKLKLRTKSSSLKFSEDISKQIEECKRDLAASEETYTSLIKAVSIKFKLYPNDKPNVSAIEWALLKVLSGYTEILGRLTSVDALNFFKAYMEDSSTVSLPKKVSEEFLNSLKLDLERTEKEIISVSHMIETRESSLLQRPKACVIDDCAFLIDLDVSELKKDLRKLSRKKKSLKDEIGQAEIDMSILDAEKRLAEIFSNLNKLPTAFFVALLKYFKIELDLSSSKKVSIPERVVYSSRLISEFLSLGNIDTGVAIKRFISDLQSQYEAFYNIVSSESELEKLEETLELATANKDISAVLEKEVEDIKSKISKKTEALSLMEENLQNIQKDKKAALDEYINVADLYSAYEKFIPMYVRHIELEEKFSDLHSNIEKLETLREQLDTNLQEIRLTKEELDSLEKETDSVKFKLARLKEYNEKKLKYEANYKKQLLVVEATDPKSGVILSFVKDFLKEKELYANYLFDIAFQGRFRISFDISEKEFLILIHKEDGGVTKDIKYVSQGERSLVKSIISLSLHQNYGSAFPILGLDEVDAVLDFSLRTNFANIINTQVEELGLLQVFTITHNEEFRNPSIPVVLFKGHTLSSSSEYTILGDFSK